MHKQFWMVYPRENPRIKLFAITINREQIKRKAAECFREAGISSDPDQYVCEPLTNPGDKVKIELILNI